MNRSFKTFVSLIVIALLLMAIITVAVLISQRKNSYGGQKQFAANPIVTNATIDDILRSSLLVSAAPFADKVTAIVNTDVLLSDSSSSQVLVFFDDQTSARVTQISPNHFKSVLTHQYETKGNHEIKLILSTTDDPAALKDVNHPQNTILASKTLTHQ